MDGQHGKLWIGFKIKDGSDYETPAVKPMSDRYKTEESNRMEDRLELHGGSLISPTSFPSQASSFVCELCRSELSGLLHLPSQLGSSLSATDTGCPRRGGT